MYSFDRGFKTFKAVSANLIEQRLSNLSSIRSAMLKTLLFHVKNIWQNKNWDCGQCYLRQMLWRHLNKALMDKLHHEIQANILTLLHRCLQIDRTLQRRTTSNQRWSNVAYVNVGIYKVEQRRISVAYFNADVNNVRQHWNNNIFNVDFQNIGQRRINVVNMTISHFKNNSRGKDKIIFLNFKEKLIKSNAMDIFFTLFPILTGVCTRIFKKPQKFLKHYVNILN